MKAADIMTRSVVATRPDMPIAEAVRLMLQDDISGLPVVALDGRLVGMVTEGDFLRRSETATERHRPRWLEFLVGPGKLAGEYVRSHGRTVAEVMTAEVIAVGEETSLDEIVHLMERHHIKRVPVLRAEKLVGIVTRANLLRAFAGLMTPAPSGTSDDATIRDRILAELGRQSWSPMGSATVAVRDGVAELTGAVFNDEQRQAMRVAAENTPGVKAVVDHLAWIEPTSGLVIEPSDDVPASPSKVGS